jgi:hypothetical protein
MFKRSSFFNLKTCIPKNSISEFLNLSYSAVVSCIRLCHATPKFSGMFFSNLKIKMFRFKHIINISVNI